MTKLLDKMAQKIVDGLIKRIGMDDLRIAIVNVIPGDIIVVDITSPREVTQTEYDLIKTRWRAVFPNNQVIVMNGFNLSLIHIDQLPKGH